MGVDPLLTSLCLGLRAQARCGVIYYLNTTTVVESVNAAAMQQDR